ncbi:MAG: hypothetical protein LAT83_01610 [Kiritimatiellae bacterium]|nr:hypothetical protein [Kiritimatiellia bacterium]
MTRIVYENGNLPAHEPAVQYPEGVSPWRTYSIGAEFIYAGLARIWPGDTSLVSKLRWISTGLFCLSIPLLAVWVGLMWKSVWAAAAAGLVLMISPAFAVRSSGLTLSRENLAFPFLSLFLLSISLAKGNLKEKPLWGWCVVAGISAGLSQVFWDFSQYLLGLWIVWHWVVYLRHGKELQNDSRLLGSMAIGLSVAALAHPYLRGQGFVFSPVMTLLYLRIGMEIPWLRARPPAVRAATVLVSALIWRVAGGLFVTNYGHFGELFWAKIRFLNQKPSDPSLLTYAQRIMWTPALNSSTWELTKAYFPVTLPLLLVVVAILFWKVRQYPVNSSVRFLLFAAGFTLPMYVLFFRMHVFLIVFAAACIGGFVTWMARFSRRWLRITAPILFLLFLTGIEFYRLLFFEPSTNRHQDPERAALMSQLEKLGMVTTIRGNRWGHPGQSYTMINGLTTALNRLEEPGPVLAGFGISGSILTDTGMPILLHPKFENPEIRERVREFYTHLFLEDEKTFRDWAVAMGARYYVHGMGSLAEGDTREAPRYMVDALHPPNDAAVRTLELKPNEAVWFQPIGGNERYRIFKIIGLEDEEFAAQFTRMAYHAAEIGDLETAREYAWRVLQSYHWKYPRAKHLIEILGRPRSAFSTNGD